MFLYMVISKIIVIIDREVCVYIIVLMVYIILISIEKLK